ncbi:hypothetical protein STEG23_020586, partial [Scotinomys teguina]
MELVSSFSIIAEIFFDLLYWSFVCSHSHCEYKCGSHFGLTLRYHQITFDVISHSNYCH